MQIIGIIGIITTTLLGAPAAPPAAAAAAEGAFKFVTTTEMIGRTKAPPAKWDFLLVDTRTIEEYNEGHILGAIPIPAKDVAVKLPRIVKDKKRQVVFYCNGPKCTKSIKAARAAAEVGYSNIVIYNEGLPAWLEAKQRTDGNRLPDVEAPGVKAQELKKAIPDGVLLLDVRDADEFAASHIAGSVNLPIDDIRSRIADLPDDKPIYLVDHTGKQVPLASRLLGKFGRKNLRHLEGGLLAWEKEGLPLEGKGIAGK